MPLPLILGGIAIASGATGLGGIVNGGLKLKKAEKRQKLASQRHQENVQRVEAQNKTTIEALDRLGEKELEILESFQHFSDLFEQIKNRPIFKGFQKEHVQIPTYDAEELKKVSIGAGVLLGGLGGAALGTAGGFAAAGATTAAVMALGTASTGTAIASLSGAAATNAALAALGGGALGTAVLGGATAGVALLIGGVIFSLSGKKLSDKADEAWKQVEQEETEINSKEKHLANNYDHFTYSPELSPFANVSCQTIDAVSKYCGGDYSYYYNHISDHLPVLMEIEI